MMSTPQTESAVDQPTIEARRERVRARLSRSLPDQEHFVFEGNGIVWARYFHHFASPYDSISCKRVAAGEVFFRQGRHVDHFVVVSVKRKIHANMGGYLDDKWNEYINHSRVFARRKKFKEGTWVQSHYQRQWFGQVFGPGMAHEGCLVVRVTHDACGRPLRKPRLTELDSTWLHTTNPPTIAQACSGLP